MFLKDVLMRFKAKKQFGEYKTDWCPYCGKVAFTKNKLKLNVCKDHANEDSSPALKTLTGEWLDVKPGKYGNYCESLNRGMISLKKGFELCGQTLDE